MKLTELNPRWVGIGSGTDFIISGLTFDCPHCKNQRLGVSFKPPIDPKGWTLRGVTWNHSNIEWYRTGDSFETITLSPSIDASQQRIDVPGHWHGFIKNGEII